MGLLLMHIRIYGDPAPQGSKTARPVYAGTGPDRHPTGQINLVESSKRLPAWRKTVCDAAAEQRAGKAFPRGMPLAVILQFYLPRPAAHYGTGRNAGRVKDSAPPYPVGKKNDGDKLERAVLDGLKDAGVYADDGQVSSMMRARDWVADGQAPGCEVWIARRPAVPGLREDSGNDQ